VSDVGVGVSDVRVGLPDVGVPDVANAVPVAHVRRAVSANAKYD
jgi:hypothetical protein